MKKSIEILEDISYKLNSHTTYYKYNENMKVSSKYRKGRVDASLWLNDLVFYFIQKEKAFLFEFKKEIERQKQKIENIKEGDYKSGLFDELKSIEDSINDRVN